MRLDWFLTKILGPYSFIFLPYVLFLTLVKIVIGFIFISVGFIRNFVCTLVLKNDEKAINCLNVNMLSMLIIFLVYWFLLFCIDDYNVHVFISRDEFGYDLVFVPWSISVMSGICFLVSLIRLRNLVVESHEHN